MAVTFNVHASFLDIAHVHVDADSGFFQSIGAKFKLVDPKTYREVVPAPDFTQTALTIVTAVLSSTVLATAIKNWLEVNRTRIEISLEDEKGKRSVVYEGPKIGHSIEEIERMLISLSGNESSKVTIEAKKVKSPPLPGFE
jgi:hypothetical protein